MAPPENLKLILEAALLAAGFLWQGLAAIEQQAQPVPVGLAQRTVVVEGWIAGPVADKPRRERFRFRVERLREPDGPWRSYQGSLRLSWYRPLASDPAYGQRWRLAVRVRRPRAFRNPGGFDYAHYLRSRGLAGTGYVRGEPPPERLAGRAGSPVGRTVERMRRRVQEAVAGSAGEAAPLVRALTVGKRDRLDPATWDMLQVIREHPGPFPTRDAGVEAVHSHGYPLAVARWMGTNLVPLEGENGYGWRIDPNQMQALLEDFFRVDAWGAVEHPYGPEIHLLKATESGVLDPDAVLRAEAAGLSTGRVFVHRIQGGHWLNADNPDALVEHFATHLA